MPLSLYLWIHEADGSIIHRWICVLIQQLFKIGSSFVFIMVTFINSWKRAVAQLFIQNEYRKPMISHPKIKNFREANTQRKGEGMSSKFTNSTQK